MIDIHEMTVLIVDDMVTMCKSIHKMMIVIGYGGEFFFASNGRQALTILHKEPIDLVMLDYNMPGMSGAEVLSRIREDRNLRNLPVLMVTAQAYRDYVAESAESEIDAYILKPLSIKLLEDKVSHVVERANNPPPMIGHLKKAMHYEHEGDIEGAIKEAELAVRANPGSSRPVRELGYYYFKKNDLKKAERCLLKAADMNDLDVFAFHYLGEIYLKLDNIEEARDYFERAMKISPRHLTRGIHFGKTLVHMKKTPQAVQVFDDVLKLSGSSLELREEIANFCMEQGINKYAAKLLASIIRRNPGRADLLFKLGVVMEELGDIKKAVTYLTKADKIDKENLDIKIHLARGYLTLDKPVHAEKPLKRILKIEPNHREARELLSQCV